MTVTVAAYADRLWPLTVSPTTVVLVNGRPIFEGPEPEAYALANRIGRALGVVAEKAEGREMTAPDLVQLAEIPSRAEVLARVRRVMPEIRGVPAPAPRAPRLNGSVVLVILFGGAILFGLCAQWILRELGGLP